MDHPRQIELVAFLAGTLAEAEAEQLYGHLAFCDACSRRLDAIQVLRREPEAALSAMEARWAAQTERESEALLEPGTPSVFDMALRVLLDPARRLATAGTQAVGSLTRNVERLAVMLNPQVAGIGSPASIDQTIRDRGRASEMLDRDEPEAAREALERARASIPGAAETCEVMLERDGAALGRIVVDARRKTVTVILTRLAEESPPTAEPRQFRPRAVLLAPSGEVRQSLPLAPVEGADYWMVEFSDTSLEEFVVGLDFGSST